MEAEAEEGSGGEGGAGGCTFAPDLPRPRDGPSHFRRAWHRLSMRWLGRTVIEELAELLDPEPLYLRRPDAAEPGARKPVS